MEARFLWYNQCLFSVVFFCSKVVLYTVKPKFLLQLFVQSIFLVFQMGLVIYREILKTTGEKDCEFKKL